MRQKEDMGEQIFFDIRSEQEKAADPAKKDTGLFFFKGTPGAKYAICSAGARMAAWLGSYGTEAFGEKAYPGPAAVIMQYTGLSEVYGNEPPTYNCVGTSDGIASYRTMERRIEAIQANGTDAMIEVFPGLSHSFGLGTGTIAEGWLNNEVMFREKHMK